MTETADNDDGLTVLDPRFPIRWTLAPRLFNELTDEWANRGTARRLTTIGARRDTITEVTYTAAMVTETAPMPALRALPPVPYPELTEKARTAEFEAIGSTLALGEVVAS